MTHTPRLSFCMIARNEAANIARCLESVAPVAAEIVVVDTGSTDETVAIAEQHGATVSLFEWCDDFAAARNAAIERASGDWILLLDADEWLLPECQPHVLAAIAYPRALAYLLRRQEVAREGQVDGFVEMYQLRLWRNDPALRFLGCCHPHFGTTLEEMSRCSGQQIMDSAIHIRHTGYLPHLKRAKLERGVRLLQKELALRPGQLYYEIELARSLAILGDPRGPEMLNTIESRLLAMADAPHAPISLVAPVLEQGIRRADPPRLDALIVLAQRWFPDSPPLLDAIAERRYQAGDFERALAPLHHMVHLAETATYDRLNAFQEDLLGDRPYLNLAVCYHRLARLDDAETWYRRLLARTPNHAGARHNLTILEQQRQQFARSGQGAS